MNCRIGLDWISCVVQLVGTLFFTIGFATRHWATSREDSVNVGLFTTCNQYCYDTHVFYNDKSEKGSIMGAAVMQIFTICGMYFVLFMMLLYMCGLFNEKSTSRGAAVTAFITALFGFISIIMFGTAMSSLSYSLGWSFALVVIGLIVDIAAGICIYIGGQQWVESQQKRRTELLPLRKHGLPSRLDPRLEPRAGPLNGFQKRTTNKFNPKQSPQLSRKSRY